VRPLRLAARRALVDPRRLDAVLRATLVAAGLRRLPLGDGHERPVSLADVPRLVTSRHKIALQLSRVGGIADGFGSADGD
jgi:hypothetical protein